MMTRALKMIKVDTKVQILIFGLVLVYGIGELIAIEITLHSSGATYNYDLNDVWISIFC